jgi:hypothetical protein
VGEQIKEKKPLISSSIDFLEGWLQTIDLTMLKKLTFILPILVSSCSQYAEYTPSGDTLKDAITGTPYSAKIYLWRESDKAVIQYASFPENTGLYLSLAILFPLRRIIAYL